MRLPAPILFGAECARPDLARTGQCPAPGDRQGGSVGLMGFGGSALHCTAAVEREIQEGTREKGQAMAQRLKRDLGRSSPKLVLVLYDPLCGLDVEALLAGMQAEIDCPLIGGGAGQPW